jgi:hypothetical protein
MYFIFRCDCGRALYAKENVATRKCVCGKTLAMNVRRIFKKVETVEEASEAVRQMQEENYGGTGFKTADTIKYHKRF